MAMILTMPVSGEMASRILVPKGKHILMDGKLGEGEWADARRIPASDSIAIYLKRDTGYFYIAIQTGGQAFSVDLYLDRGKAASILNLHASAKLGEREGQFGQWPEWSWWNNQGWAANVVRVETFEPRKFLPDEAKEYQVEMPRLRARRFWLSADVQ